MMLAACSSGAFDSSPKGLRAGDCVDRTPASDPEGDFAQAIDRLARRECSTAPEWVVLSSAPWRPPQDSPDLHPACRSDAASAGFGDLPVVGEWETVPAGAGHVVLALLVPESYTDSASTRWRVCLVGADARTRQFTKSG